MAMRVPKTADLVASQIRRQIVRGDLKEDDALPSETALMAEFGISRPTLREAFRILESEGLISVRRGARGGARVHVPTHAIAASYAALVLQFQGVTVTDFLAARAIIEAPAAGIVAARRDRVSCARRLAEQQEAAAGIVDPATHAAFHRLLVELTGNQTLMLVTSMLEHILERTGQLVQRRIETAYEKQFNRALKAHDRLVELIRVGDAEGAEEYWRRHLEEGARELISPLPPGQTLDLL